MAVSPPIGGGTRLDARFALPRKGRSRVKTKRFSGPKLSAPDWAELERMAAERNAAAFGGYPRDNLKRFRAIATRYEKTARNYLVLVQVACVRLWLN